MTGVVVNYILGLESRRRKKKEKRNKPKTTHTTSAID